jgi:nucleoporin NUP82
VYPAPSRLVNIHTPTTLKQKPLRQGPFLLQPSPRDLNGSEGGEATDIVILSFANDAYHDKEDEMERFGIILVTSQDGKVDICLDVDKVDARWETHRVSTSSNNRWLVLTFVLGKR